MTKGNDWNVLCPACQQIIGTPETLKCPNCTGPLFMPDFASHVLKCRRCTRLVTAVQCECSALATGSFIRRTSAVDRYDTGERASGVVCPACGSHHTNKIANLGCMLIFMIMWGWILLFIPTIIYYYYHYFRKPNTRCLDCGHQWYAKVNAPR